MNKIKEFFSLLINRFVILCQAVGYSLKTFGITAKGQHPKFEILQLSHRLEKGLLNENPKPLWGWDKAFRIAKLIKINKDDFSNRTGRGVLKAYIEIKQKSNNAKEKEMALSFMKSYPEIINEKTLGGITAFVKNDVIIKDKEEVERFFKTRHTVREYKDEIVSKEDIDAAISLAMKCPSACNRQVTHCYVYQSKELQSIILTSNIRAYDESEFNDWFVSPSIFAGYLSLSLHLYGIGSCIYRKQLYGHHPYNEKMRKICNISDDEIIILELRFGYYKDSFNVAVSNRHAVCDITTYVKE